MLLHVAGELHLHIANKVLRYSIDVPAKVISKKLHLVLRLYRLHAVVDFLYVSLIVHVKTRARFSFLDLQVEWVSNFVLNLLDALISHALLKFVLGQLFFLFSLFVVGLLPLSWMHLLLFKDLCLSHHCLLVLALLLGGRSTLLEESLDIVLEIHHLLPLFLLLKSRHSNL